MKAILYVGAVLMTGAIIYGFVDYRETSRSKEFNRLYEQTESTAPATAIPETKTEAVIKKKNSDVKKEQGVVKRSGLKNTQEKIASKESKRDVIPVTTLVTEKTEEIVPVLKDEKNESALKEIKTKKRLNYRMFSRAPLKVIPSEKKGKK